MKKLFSILLLALVGFVAFGQTNISYIKTLDVNESSSEFSYYSFPLGSSDYLAATKDSALFTVNLNKHYPCEVYWFVKIDTVAAPDSANLNIKHNYKRFSDESYTTLKTRSWDGDGTGDFSSAVIDSSYLNGNYVLNKNISLTKPEFARIHQLSITPTPGAGIGKNNDRILIKKVEVKVVVRK